MFCIDHLVTYIANANNLRQGDVPWYLQHEQDGEKDVTKLSALLKSTHTAPCPNCRTPFRVADL